MSASFSVFFVVVYSILQTSFAVTREARTSFSSFLPTLYAPRTSLNCSIETTITFFIVSSALDTMQKLKAKNETTKLASFRQLCACFAVLFACVLALNLLLLGSDLDKVLFAMWKYQWV